QAKQILFDINLQLLTYLNRPTDLQIEIVPELDFSKTSEDDDEEEYTYRFEPAFNYIIMSAQLIGPSGQRKLLSHGLINLAHEYGHAILDANLQSSEVLSEYLQVVKQTGALMKRQHELEF